ncbi:MAG: valine--tRNA ligase [Erysipelotrichaceae bacterium]|nr:valine--tRNA ligase [Erysipelotrichaceae bacterium]
MLEQKYDHNKVETGVYQDWVDRGYFTAGDITKKPYSMVIPPPNVTGMLHLGHAWDFTLMDIITRYKRLQGYDVLSLPGMDHAGIATQAKVDARLKSEGVSRYDIGREKFLERAWEWKEEYAGHIRRQWASMGLGFDYSRERFTLDEGLSKAVKREFVQLYKEGLLYRGKRIINWDPVAQTALSNIEVIHKDTEGAMYTFRYDVVETGESLEVATTRPETMFGDVCVVVHPDDERYQHLIGLHVINPANHQPLPIIADDYIDIEFGTGAMKCTPAHDPNDYKIGEKYGFDKPVCINPDATMNALAGEYDGLDRFDCREKLVKRIESEGHLVKIEKIIHPVGHSERTDAIVEPYLSDQWFVRMEPLAKAVLDKQKDPETKINFYPERFERTFIQWMENIEDWCISRQLWWGHRIPVWYHKETGEIYCEEEAPADIENWVQDEDVLDTWFSSCLWPFSTLGWPDTDAADYKRYYPTSCLETGYDIIFFWVARMAFCGRHFTDNRPFKDVLIHGLIRDEQGRKMSKSLGNGVDPRDVIEKYGADSLRFFLTTNSTPGQDMRYIDSKVEASWNFINKLWNASRFVEMNLGDFTLEDVCLDKLNNIDIWMFDRLNATIKQVVTNMDRYEFALAGNEVYDFVWNDFCNWYIELTKSTLSSDDPDTVRATKSTLLTVLTEILKLLHPYIPFVTENIYASLPHKKAALCIEDYPQVRDIDASKAEEVNTLIDVITGVRTLRVDYNIKPSQLFDVAVNDEDGNAISVDPKMAKMYEKLAKVRWVEKLEGNLVVRPLNKGSMVVDLGQIVDFEEEKKKLEKEKARLEGEIKRGEGMLSNPNFTSKAPAAKVAREKEKLESYKQQYAIVLQQLADLNK